MTFELWNGVSGNLVGAYASEDAVLDAARLAGVRNGAEYLQTLAVIVEDDDGNSHLLIEGRQLAQRLGGGRPQLA